MNDAGRIPQVSTTLPPAAVRALQDTQQIREPRERQIALEKVTARIKQQYPHHFHKEQ